MDLTYARHPAHLRFIGDLPLSSGWAAVAVGAALLLIFALDRATGSAPVQHLYYVPIIFAAMRFRGHKGLLVALAAIVLYHLANPRVWTFRYEESDILQIAVFTAAGIVADRVASDGRRLHQLAMTDDLTGLHNLRSFEARLGTMVRVARQTRTPLSLLVLDLDRLKAINDVHGHLAGAEAVRTVGRILADRLPPSAVACRYGGDEFVVALPGQGPLEARRVAEDLRRAVFEAAPALAGIEFPRATLSISIGVAGRTFEAEAGLDAPSPGDVTGEALFRAADAALYAAKSTGRNRISVA